MNCAIDNPVIAKSIVENLAAAAQQYAMTKTTMGWPIEIDDLEL
jgi:hypothetical protein